MNGFDTDRKSVRVFRVHGGRHGQVVLSRLGMNRIANTCSLEASITGYPSPRGLCASFSPGVNIIGRALKAYQYQVVFRFVDLVRKQTGA
jgi:hypothetical protein